jgi:hypothetical protein
MLEVAMRPASHELSTPDIEFHYLLLRLTGQLPAELVAESRRQVAEGALVDAASAIVAAAAASAVPVTAAGVALFDRVLTGHPAASKLEELQLSDNDMMPAHQFSPAGPTDLPEGAPQLVQTLDLTSATRAAIQPDAVDVAATALVSAEPGAIGMWRTWRYDMTGATAPTRVYLVELSAGSDVDAQRLPAFAGSLQAALAGWGDVPPQVEAYRSGDELPVYHQFARMWSALVWAHTSAPEIRLARVFDRTDPKSGPVFEPDHPTITNRAQRNRLLRYLEAGQMLMSTTSMMDDIVVPDRRGVVPLNFRTDGRWIWPDAVGYYLGVHHLAPDPQLLEHISGSDPAPEALDSVAIHRTLAFLQAPGEDLVWTIGGTPEDRDEPQELDE